MDIIEALAPYAPVFQTLLWALLIAIVLIAFHTHLKDLIGAVRRRVESGSSLKAGPLELGEDLHDLKYIEPGPTSEPRLLPAHPAPGTPEEWEKRRVTIYERHRGIFLTHVLEPSRHPKQEYDIFIYLVRHKSEDFGDVSHAEFFFGHMWGNEIFRAQHDKGLIGISTSAWGPFLCTCRVTFTDGTCIDIHRYIDFEMGRVLENEHVPSPQRSRKTRR